MSLKVRYLFVIFVLINYLKECHISCRMNVRYTHDINDCFHLCFGIQICIEDCEQGYQPRSQFNNRYNWEERTSNRNRDSIFNYGSGQQNWLSKSFGKVKAMSFVTSFLMLEEEQPTHCGLRFKEGSNSQKSRSPLGTLGLGRIVGGEDAEPNEFPWLASLQITKKNLQRKHVCGAAIINEYYILTAAHCTQSLKGKEEQIIIKVGINNFEEKGQTVYPEEFIIHEGWDVETQVNDISLIRLKNPIRYTTNNLGQYIVNAICLPSDFSDPKGFAQLAGWGQLSEDDKASADWLQKITLPIWDRRKCRVNYRDYMNILKTHICAGGRGGKDSCMGDSGGPLMYEKGDRTFIVGIVSFGIPCAIKGLPGVYTHLAYYMDWLNDNLI